MIHTKKLWKYVALVAVLGVLLMTRALGEPDEALEVCGVSVDYGTAKRFHFGFEVAVTGGADSYKTISSRVVEVEADSLKEALAAADLRSHRAMRLNSASLLVMSAAVTAETEDVAVMFLREWTGQMNIPIAVAAEGPAADILRNERSDNLRAATAGEQIRAAARAGEIEAPDAPAFFSRYLSGAPCALPMLEPISGGYAITGSYQCG